MKELVSVLIAGSLSAALAAAQPAPEHAESIKAPDVLELELDGVIVAASPGDSIALVRRAHQSRARAVRVGQELGGYVLLEVTRDSALFEGSQGRLWISLAGSTPPVLPARPDSNEPQREPLWIRRSFSRAEANQRLEKEIPVILSDTEVTPRVVEGEVRGIEVLRLPDGTVLSRSGLLPGDVVRSINEEPLIGLDSLWRLLARFSGDDELRVIVERRGEVVRFAYELTK